MVFNRVALRTRAQDKKMTVAITGATGLVGTRLCSHLTTGGHTVRALTRDAARARAKLPPNVTPYAPSDWARGVEGCTGVVNLAGEPISTRWNDEVKTEIRNSRINTTKTIVNLINAQPDPAPVLVSASAIGFYGVSQSDTFTEASGAGGDFLAQLCVDWEREAMQSKSRTSIIRTGIVLAKEGGALAKIMPVFSLFAGGPLGSGEQWCSWVHPADLVSLYVHALQNPQMSGPYNATAPTPVRMLELCTEIGKAMGRPSWLPVPEFAVRLLLGEGACIVLDGQRVVPKRTMGEGGYEFQYDDVGAALKNLLE